MRAKIEQLLKTKKMTILRLVLGVVVGGALGFAYYKLVGCRTGSCPITSNPWASIIYGAIFGALIAYK